MTAHSVITKSSYSPDVQSGTDSNKLHYNARVTALKNYNAEVIIQNLLNNISRCDHYGHSVSIK